MLTSLFMKTTMCIGATFIVEQPQSSLLFNYPPIQQTLQRAKAQKAAFAMRDFLGDSQKQLVLWGTAGFIVTFQAVAQRRSTTSRSSNLTTLASHSGKSFTGKTNELKKSSGYTRSMAVAMALSMAGLAADAVVFHMSKLKL